MISISVTLISTLKASLKPIWKKRSVSRLRRFHKSLSTPPTLVAEQISKLTRKNICLFSILNLTETLQSPHSKKALIERLSFLISTPLPFGHMQHDGPNQQVKQRAHHAPKNGATGVSHLLYKGAHAHEVEQAQQIAYRNGEQCPEKGIQ